LHAAQGAVVARAGKHVVSEKPMALSLAQADSLMRACEAAGVQLFVVKQNRLNPPIQLVKRAIDKERFGRIYLANVTVRWQRPQEYYDAEPWRGTWEFDGGAMMNQASHYVDLIQWLVGPVESVMAKTATQARRIEAEDSGIAILVPLGRARRHRGERAHLSEEPRGLDHDPRRARIGEDRRHRGEQDRALGPPTPTRTTSSSSRRAPIRRTYGFGHEGYYPQRACGAARRSAAGDGRTRGAQVARVDPGDLRTDRMMREVLIPRRTRARAFVDRGRRPHDPSSLVLILRTPHAGSHAGSTAGFAGAARDDSRRDQPGDLGIVESQLFILGAPVERLEREAAALSHAKYAVGCASGTDALLLALRALDVGPGDEVVTTPFTFSPPRARFTTPVDGRCSWISTPTRSTSCPKPRPPRARRARRP
jgi:UDP-N-acetyl-2-amino-2-deoxyglucuronate dehydrogenase